MDIACENLCELYQSGTGRGLSFRAFCDAGRNWSLADLYSEQRARKNPELVQELSRILSRMGARHVFAPTPTHFNGQVVQPYELNVRIPLSQGRNPLVLWRNGAVFADGTMLTHQWDAGIFSAGGCAMVVAAYKKHMAFAHAGRDCVLDKKRIESDDAERGRANESVAHSLIETLHKVSGEERFDMSQFEAWVFWSIRPEEFRDSFDDPKWGAWNRRVAHYVAARYGEDAAIVRDRGVELDIPAILRKQFLKAGALSSHVYLDAAYLPGRFPTTRNGKPGRYLTGVVRTR